MKVVTHGVDVYTSTQLFYCSFIELVKYINRFTLIVNH